MYKHLLLVTVAGVLLLATGTVTAQDAGIKNIEVVNPTDPDNDGYYSGFDVRVTADTKCFGCYVDQENIVPWFEAWVNDDYPPSDDFEARSVIVETSDELTFTITVDGEFINRYSRQSANLKVKFFDAYDSLETGEDPNPGDFSNAERDVSSTVDVNIEPDSQEVSPKPSFTYSPTDPEVGSTISFDGSGSSDPDGSIQSYEWDFNGDGVTDGTGEKASHSYSSSGDYTVTLTVTDDEGATDTTTQTVSVSKEETETNPTGTFTYSPNSPTVSEEVTFDASTSSDDGTIQSYLWDFNGDGLTDATGQTASHKFTDSGEYTVELTVSNDQGLSDTVTNTVSVEESGSTVGNISIDNPATVTPNGEFSVTLQMPQVATSAVEVVSSNFSVSLSGDGTEANTASEDMVRREFIDVQADGGSYDVTVNIENSSEGDTGTITAYAGGEGNETDHNAKQVSTFSVFESGDSPIDGVSDRLWMEVTGGGELTLGDLGTAIQQYQQNGEINGVSISLGDLGSLIQHYQSG